MPQAGNILYLRPLRPVSFILAKRSFHKFYFTLEKKFTQITLHISILDPWLESGQIQKLLSHLLVKANRFILTIYKARHTHKRLYTVLPKYSKIQVLPGITSCRLVKDNKQAIELNSLLLNNMPKDGYG